MFWKIIGRINVMIHSELARHLLLIAFIGSAVGLQRVALAELDDSNVASTRASMTELSERPIPVVSEARPSHEVKLLGKSLDPPVVGDWPR